MRPASSRTATLKRRDAFRAYLRRLTLVRRNASPPPPPPPSAKSCATSGLRRGFWGASMSSLALFSPMSLRAGTDEVGWSPRLARLGLVLRRSGMADSTMVLVQLRQAAAASLSDKAARTESPPAAPTSMGYRWVATALLLAAGAPAFGAAGPDPLKSDACKAAIVALEQVAGENASATRAARLAQARENAATVCFGRGSDRGTRSGAPYPAQSVSPSATSAPRSLPSPPAVAPAPPAPPAPRPAVITTCDPAGCWDSDGRRLNQMGPLLMSPRGPCTPQGGLANCP